jgi:hypothetical protein
MDKFVFHFLFNKKFLLGLVLRHDLLLLLSQNLLLYYFLLFLLFVLEPMLTLGHLFFKIKMLIVDSFFLLF